MSENAKYPLMSRAVAAGLYHPNCRDNHTTYFEGISTPPDSKFTKKELEDIEEQAKAEARKNYATSQATKLERMAKYSLDKDNKRIYESRAKSWKEEVKRCDTKLEELDNYEKEYIIDEEQEYRPISRSTTIATRMRGKRTITMRQVENTTYKGGVHISDNVALKPKQMHFIEKSLNDAIKLVGVGDNVPTCIIISSAEMQTNAICSYNAVNNILYIDSIIGDTGKLLELQKDLACPNNPLSTYVHELLHWKDAEEYRKIATITNQAEYLKNLRAKCKKKLDKLVKQGYNIKEISNYATDKYYSGAYDETLTEYYVLKLLGKGD